MKATRKRRGRPRKTPVSPRNDSPASEESNHRATHCNWTSESSPCGGLKIVLKKIDVRSALVRQPNGRSTLNKNLTILSPKLTLSRIDSIAERSFSFLSIDDHGNGQSVQRIFTSFSESVYSRPDMQPMTRNICSMNTLVDDSRVRRPSRKVLKDVKNTSSNRETRKNVSVQPDLNGQENVPVSSFDASVAYPCVRLTQLKDQNLLPCDLVEKRFVESSSTANSVRDAINARFQSLRRLENGEPRMILDSFFPTNGIRRPVQSEAAKRSSPEAAPPAKKARKRKTPVRKTARESRREGAKKKVENTRSSSIVTRQKSGRNGIKQLPNTSPLGLEETEIRVDVDISTVELHYSPAEKKTIKKSEQQSFSFIGKRKWRDDSPGESSEYSAPKKRPFGDYNGNKVQPSPNGKEVQQSPNAICAVQPSNSSESRTHLSTRPSSSSVTQNKASRSKRSASSNTIPWKTVKRIEQSTPKPAKSDVKENCCPKKPKVTRKNVRTEKESSKIKPVNSYLCYRTRQRVAQSEEPNEFYQMPWKKTKGLEVVPNKSKKVDIKTETDDEEAFKGWSSNTSDIRGTNKNIRTALPRILPQDAPTSVSKKGILKQSHLLASSTPFPQSSRRNVNVSFASDTEFDALSPVNSHQKPNDTNRSINGFPLRSCSVVLNCLPNTEPQSPSGCKKRMTRREARQKAESFNQTRKALEAEAEYSKSPVKKSRRGLKRSDRIADKRSSGNSTTSEEEPEIVVSRNRQNTPCVRLRRLNAEDITSYKITPLKEDRIPKKSKTVDDYGIDDINTDESTDDEEYPKKCIPQWAKDYLKKPVCLQSYMKQKLIDSWMRPPNYKYSLQHTFFSRKSHTYI